MGYGHYLETVGDEPCAMLAIFNSGTYQEISLSKWLAQTPTRLLETNFNVSPSIIESLKKASGLFSVPDKAPKQ
jgi:oxalate decarboxylase